jgi:hypothetical protein
VAVVNRKFVSEFLSETGALGQVIRLADGAEYEIAGVCGDVFVISQETERVAPPQVYVPFSSAPMNLHTFFVVRTAADPTKMIRTLQEELWAVDKNQPFGYIRTAHEDLWLFQYVWPQTQTVLPPCLHASRFCLQPEASTASSRIPRHARRTISACGLR